MSSPIPPMIVEIELETARIKSQLDDLTRKFQSMGDNIGKQTNQVDKITGGFKKLGGALVAIAAGAQVVSFLKESVAAASSFEAEFEGVNQTFGDSAKIVQDYAKNAAYSAGLSETAALQAAKGFGAFAGAAGLAGKDAANFATQMVQAAGDLGSFYDLPTGDAMAAIQSGLRGQFEPLRRFNILIDDATLRQRALQMGMIETTKTALTPQQKAIAANAEIMAQMGAASGDFVKYADTYGNAIKTVGALFDDLKQRLGSALLPALAKLAMALMPLIEQIGPLATQVLAALAPAIDALVPAITGLIPALQPVFSLLTSVAKQIGPILNTLLPPLIAIVNKVAAVLGPLLETILPPILKIVDIAMPILSEFMDIFIDLVEAILPPVVSILEGAVIPVIQLLADIFKKYLMPVLQVIIDQLGDTLPVVADVVVQAIGAVVDIITWVTGAFDDWSKQSGISIKDLMTMFNPLLLALKAVDFVLKGVANGFYQLRLMMKGDWAGAAAMGLMDVETAYASWHKKVTGTRAESDRYSGMEAMGKALGLDKPSGSGTGAYTGGFTGPVGGKNDPAKAAADAKKVAKAVSSAVKDARDAMAKANKTFDDASTKSYEQFNEKIVGIVKKRDEDLAAALTDHNAKVASINADFAKRLNDIVQQSMDRLRSAFKTASTMDVGSTFASMMQNNNLSNVVSTEMKNGMKVAVSWWGQATNEGGVGGVVTALKEKLAGAKKLAENAAALSGAGFSQTFIEQVVGQGTTVGNQMAQEILNSSPETMKEMQSLYGDLEKVSETGIDGVAKKIYEKNGLATAELKKMYSDTQGELVKALADEQAAYNTAVADINKTFKDAFATAQDDLNKSLSDAYQALADSLVATKKKFNDEMVGLNLTAGQKKTASGLNASLTAGITDAKSTGATFNTTIQVETNATAQQIAQAYINQQKFNMPITTPTAALASDASTNYMAQRDAAGW